MPPEEVIEEAVRLTRAARAAVEEGEAAAARQRRDELLAEHGYCARERDDDTLVCYPEEWVEDGEVRTDRIDDTDAAVERPLTPGGGEYGEVEAHNARAVERVRKRHGEVHARNARAFADFLGNHYLARVERATPALREEFLTEYFPRNAWPTDQQRAVVERSLELVAVAGREVA
jgi:hypothetical protein